MEDKIITKLKLALSEPIKKECQIVYIIAEIRKLLEKKGIKSDYSVLNFYCNWVLHSAIDKVEPEIQELIEEIERTFFSANRDIFIPEKILNFELFRKDFQEFISRFGINYNIEKGWIVIRRLFIDIISDCPLKIKNGSIKEFSFIHSEDYKEAECMIKFRNKTPDRINVGLRFQNY